MKLKQEIESYNVKSLEGIEHGVGKMRQHCQDLCKLGEFLKYKIQEARNNGFQDVNTDRAELLISEYVKKLSAAEFEYSELSTSVRQFIDKIETIWEDWR